MKFNYYRFMLEDMSSTCLKVCLIDAPEPQHAKHKIRVAFSQNPEWYRKMCLEFPAKQRLQKRKFDTKVKRQAIIQMLKRMAEGNIESKSKYVKHLKQIADNMEQADIDLNNTPF